MSTPTNELSRPGWSEVTDTPRCLGPDYRQWSSAQVAGDSRADGRTHTHLSVFGRPRGLSGAISVSLDVYIPVEINADTPDAAAAALEELREKVQRVLREKVEEARRIAEEVA